MDAGLLFRADLSEQRAKAIAAFDDSVREIVKVRSGYNQVSHYIGPLKSDGLNGHAIRNASGMPDPMNQSVSLRSQFVGVCKQFADAFLKIIGRFVDIIKRSYPRRKRGV